MLKKEQGQIVSNLLLLHVRNFQEFGKTTEDTSVPRLSTSRKLRSSVARFLSLGTVSKPLRRRRGARCARDREVSREVTLTWQCAGVFACLFTCLFVCMFFRTVVGMFV